jgi:hypothetical protein
MLKANLRIKRVVFMCTPHRGSKLAISPMAELAMRLITLPSNVARAINSQGAGAFAGKGNPGPAKCRHRAFAKQSRAENDEHSPHSGAVPLDHRESRSTRTADRR